MTAHFLPTEGFLHRDMASPQRLRWLFTEYPIYFITFCAYNRRRILDRQDVHETFIQFGLHAAEHGVSVGRYVIMPDHIHLFAGFGPQSKSLSAWMKSLKNAISKTLKNATFPAPHWQKGFFDHLIRSDQSYEQKWLYVRDNPVRAGLVRSAEDWPYAGKIARLSD
jgi:putative transposase